MTTKLITYSCAICGMRFGDPDAAFAARERDRHQELDHAYVAPTHEQNIAQREALMAAAGFPVGTRVRALVSASDRLPQHVRFERSDEGTVVLNLAMPAELVPVRFGKTRMLHALAPENVEAI